MQWKIVKFAMVMALALGASASAVAARNFSDDLQLAEQLRSSDAEKFSVLVDRMEAGRDKASRLERQRHDLLKAFRTAIYGNKPEKGIRIATSIYKSTSDPAIKFRSASLIANLSGINRDFRTGLRYLEKAMAMRGKVEQKDVRHEGVGSAAVLYNEMGQYELGLKYAEEILGEEPSRRNACFATSVRLAAMQALGRLDPLAPGFDAGIQQCLRINELMAASKLRVTWARFLLAEKKADQALVILEGGMEDAEKTKYPWLIAEVRSVLAEIKYALGDAEAARGAAEATLELRASLPSSKQIATAYQVLYRLEEDAGRPVSALGMYKQYAEAEKNHLSDVRARELAYEIVRQETLQKNQQIELLERQNEVLQLEQELDKQSALKARLAMVFLMLVLAAVIYWMLQIKRHQRQLQRLAQTDMLTGVGNRHYFTLKSEKALHDAAREGEQAALVMFDLDHFKAINDTYGHGAGDWVLKQVGRICRTHCRKTDYLGRIGGEEFAIMLRGVDLAEAARIAEDCRSTLAQIDTRESGYSFVVTGSFGVTSTGQSGYDLSRLMSHSDQMLYRAKHEGRNRVCVYAPDSPEPKPGRRSAPALTVVGR